MVARAYPLLQRELKRRAVRLMLSEGPGGPLAFLWALSAAIFLAALRLPLLIVPLSAAALACGWLMLRDFARDRAVVQRLVPPIVRDLWPAPNIPDAAVEERLAEGQQLFAEIAIRALAGGYSEASAELIVSQAADLVAMQHELARQARELGRVLELAGHSGHGASQLGGLLAANASLVRAEAEKAAALTAEIVDQLQALLLQLSRAG